MKKIVFALLISISFIGTAQTKSELLKHYEAFYKQMRLQGDVNGIINALTHLNVLTPSDQRNDTLAYIYANDNQHMQALNTIGIEKNDSDSDLAVQVKAISLKALNQPKRAIEQFEVLYKRNPNPFLAYELADLKIQIGDPNDALVNIEYGIANAKEEMKYAFYERQQPYEVPLKAAFLHLKGLVTFNLNRENIDGALSYIDEALVLDPTFNLASLSKQALENKKNPPTAEPVPAATEKTTKKKKQ
jgi:tetratricopeptide (TPR) repeat protein